MKKLIVLLALVVSITSIGQTKKKYFELSMSGMVSNYREPGYNLDAGIFPAQPKWFPSLNADVYTAKKPQTQRWTTAQVGARLNVVVWKYVLLSAGPKWVTQGNEKTTGYNQWIFDGAVSSVFKLAERDDGIMWFKLSVQYNSTPQQRVFLLAGLQFALR